MRVLNDFKCKDCGNVQEELLPHDFYGDVICKECGGQCQKIMSSSQNFRLQGDGFYAQSHGDWD